MDWLPVSAALLLTGALAVAVGSFLLPSTDGSAQTLQVVEHQDEQWLAVAVILFLASVFLTLGLPSVLALFHQRGWRLALVSAVVLEIGFLGTAGYSMLMVFFRSLVTSNAIRGKALDDVTGDLGLAVFLYGWIVGFYLGELLLAIALLRARVTPRWVPGVLILHVAMLPVSLVLPHVVGKVAVLLLVAGFAGIAMQAGSRVARPVR